MKVYAARYSSCFFEYGPTVISLHLTREGAEKAISVSQKNSLENFNDMQNWMRQEIEEGRGNYSLDEQWSLENGDGFEKWMITEMEVEE